jgi:DNA replication protein DnaC
MISSSMPENPIARIRHNLVGLRMPRALEALEGVIQQLERGQLGAIEAIDTLFAEEITVREGRRIKAALQMARLATIKTLTGFDFSFQPSLDRNRIMALASLDFVDKYEVVHFIGQSGTGKSHLAIALGVEAIWAGRSVYFCPLADIVEPRGSPDIDSLAKADREERLRERIRYLCRTQLLIIDEIGYVTLGAAAGNLFFQLVNARYERGATILTSNRGFAEWGQVFGDPVIATALLDRLLHHAVVVHIEGSSYRMRQHADLLPPVPPPGPRPDAQPKRRGRPPKAAADTMQAA